MCILNIADCIQEFEMHANTSRNYILMTATKNVGYIYNSQYMRTMQKVIYMLRVHLARIRNAFTYASLMSNNFTKKYTGSSQVPCCHNISKDREPPLGHVTVNDNSKSPDVTLQLQMYCILDFPDLTAVDFKGRCTPVI